MSRDRREKQQGLGRSTQARVAFLLISIPWSGVVFFFWFFGAMAK